MAEPPEKIKEAQLGDVSEVTPGSTARKLFGEVEKLLQSGGQILDDKTPIGTATKSEDGTIHLHLKARGGGPISGETTITYGTQDPRYKEILDHLGGLNQGETKQVKPWSDQIRRQDLGGDDKTKDDKSKGDKPDGAEKPGDKKADAPDVPPLAPTAGFTKRVNDTYNQIPKNVRDAIEKDGVTVVATDKVTDVLPDLKGVKPRGWPPGSSWEDVDGAYDIDGKRAIVAERQNAGNKPQNRNVEGLTRHEVGHAADDVGKFSDSKDFKDSYNKDLPGIPGPAAQTLEYFLQSGSAGREEMWAEGFAVETGGASQNIFTPLLKAHFVEAMKVIKDQIQKMK